MHPLESALRLSLTKPSSTWWKPTCWEEVLGFALRRATATPNLAPWVCHHQKPSVKLWDSLCWYGSELDSCNDITFPILWFISLRHVRTVAHRSLWGTNWTRWSFPSIYPSKNRSPNPDERCKTWTPSQFSAKSRNSPREKRWGILNDRYCQKSEFHHCKGRFY